MKRLLALLLALCMLFALAACGGGGETTSPDDTNQNPDDPPGDTPDDSDTAPVDNVVRMGRDMASVGNLNSLLTTYNSIFEVSDCCLLYTSRPSSLPITTIPSLTHFWKKPALSLTLTSVKNCTSRLKPWP